MSENGGTVDRPTATACPLGGPTVQNVKEERSVCLQPGNVTSVLYSPQMGPRVPDRLWAAVAYRVGGVGGVQTPPEIPKFLTKSNRIAN